MAFKDILISDLQTVFFSTAECAEVFAYTSQGSSASRNIKVIIDAGEHGLQSPEPPTDMMQVVVMSSEVDRPDFRDKFVFGSSTYHLINNLEGDAALGTFTLQISKSQKRRV
jgi:hypothetical protein